MNPAPITQQLAARACAVSLATAPPAIHTLVRQCVLDYLGVTLAGATAPAVQLLHEELREEGGNPRAGIVGSRHRMALAQAALLNGMAAHVLDYDDVNFALMGHPSVPILPALLAQAECLNASGSAVMAAFLAGYETECRIGLLVAPGHYTGLLLAMDSSRRASRCGVLILASTSWNARKVSRARIARTLT